MAGDEPVRLRGHHLLCLLTYKGLGYSPGFVAGMTATAGRLAAGTMAEIVEDPDDICAPLCCVEEHPHCHEATVPERDRRALFLIAAVLGRPLMAGDRLVLDQDIRVRLRAAYRDGAFEAACALCEWQPLCRDIAASDYAGTLFHSPDEPA
ncbi:MAG: 2Fe-2S ferredoxin [Proteobacteria bacterium]|nr:2Fe-2S ferredoxin [Pseudomonadota bacterium]